MNKVIGIPHSSICSDASLSFFDKFTNDLLLKYWNFKCRRMSYEKLVIQSKITIDEILTAHNLRSSYYQNINFEVTITSNKGWTFELSKAFYNQEESIILILLRDQAVGQSSYSICFDNDKGLIKGIKNMFHGLMIDTYFYDLESPLLNPNVLAALIVASKALKKGKVTSLQISNRSKYFGEMKLHHLKEIDLK